MKVKLFQILIIICLFSGQIKAQNLLDSGLVAYYPFNGNAGDSSAYGNHPIFNNATLTFDRFGNPNSAYSFNGVNTYMKINNNPSINFNKSMSICLWMKPTGYYTGLCYNNVLVCKGITDNNPGNAGNYSVRFADYVNGCNSLKDSTQEYLWGADGVPATNQKIQTNRWYFVVYTTDGVNSSLYINNKLCHTISHPTNLTFTNNYDLFFGMMNNTSYPYFFKGVMDDIRIYNRGLSLLEVNDLYNISPYPIIKGNVYVDVNGNGIMDSTDYYKPNARVNGSNGTFAITGVNGDYEIVTDTIGDYITSIIQPNYYTATPQSFNYSINNYDTTLIGNYTLQNISQPVDSLSSYIIPLFGAARPGFSYPVGVTYTNEGNTLLNPKLIVFYDSSKLHFVNSTNPNLVDSGSFLIIPTADLLPGQRVSFLIDFKVNATAVLGDTVKLVSYLDASIISCTDSVQTRIVGSFDPNDIQATESLTTVQVAQGKQIKYIIRFENTGTDTAFKVIITDQLSNLLNKNSIELIGSSHPCKISVKSSIFTFTFSNINLPDSNKSKLMSHGYVAFNIKPISTVTPGTIISNSASIYFDYNKPVLTNNAITKIVSPILPLKMVVFSGNIADFGVATNWKTALEKNVLYFNIQRSINGTDFYTVGKVLAKGDGNYSFLDSIKLSNTKCFYYRLEICDNNGFKTYSNIIYISILNDESYRIYPNPTSGIMYVYRTRATNENAEIIDVLGKKIINVKLINKQDILNLDFLENGVYFLKFERGKTIKFIKK